MGLAKVKRRIAEYGITIKILSFSFLLILLSSGGLLLSIYFKLSPESAFGAGALLSLGVFSIYLSHNFIGPISRLIKMTNRIGEGLLDARIEVDHDDEIGRLAMSINKMTEMLEQKLSEVSLLGQISRESTMSRNLNKVLNLILDRAVTIHKADAGSIMLVDRDTGDLIIKAAKNLNSEIVPGTRVPKGQGVAGWVAREGRPIVLIDGIGSDFHFLHDEDVQNAVSLPILLDSLPVGVLNLSYRDSRRGKRFSPEDLGFLTTLANHAAAAINNAQLFEELRNNYFSTIQALSAAIDAKDPYTHGHSARVAEYALAAAETFDLGEDELEMVQAAAYLHDVGKIGIPEPILTKPGKLTEKEFEIIRTHPEISAKILAPVNFHSEIISCVRHHHERIDGAGYPDKISGKDIPFVARILAVADAFDAMTSVRPYRPAIPADKARDELLRCAGTQFDGEIVQAFLSVHDTGPSSDIGTPVGEISL